jgi:hypothetical protein
VPTSAQVADVADVKMQLEHSASVVSDRVTLTERALAACVLEFYRYVRFLELVYIRRVFLVLIRAGTSVCEHHLYSYRAVAAMDTTAT